MHFSRFFWVKPIARLILKHEIFPKPYNFLPIPTIKYDYCMIILFIVFINCVVCRVKHVHNVSTHDYPFYQLLQNYYNCDRIWENVHSSHIQFLLFKDS